MNTDELREAYGSRDESERLGPLDRWSHDLHRAAKEKGFYDSLDMTTFNSQAKQLMMIVSECSEVMEALRKQKGQDSVGDEVADILIRVFDFWGALVAANVVDISLDESLSKKTVLNKGRPRMHGVLG